MSTYWSYDENVRTKDLWVGDDTVNIVMKGGGVGFRKHEYATVIPLTRAREWDKPLEA